MKVHLRMLGCRLNQAEIDHMARQLAAQGHEIVDTPDHADEVIVNTCAVTHDAVRSGRRLVREMHRANPAAAITVTGCHAQIAPQQLAALPGVAGVVGNRDKDNLVRRITGVETLLYELEPHQRAEGAAWRTRAFVKVQDGCDNACTFCVTTVARGEGRSRPMDEVLHEVRSLHAMGYQEVVLTGVHLGSYGHDFGQQDGLYTLTQRLLDETDIPRLRLSSLEPWDLNDGFFELWRDARLCPHLHLPLQSGCDATLRRMRRNTTPQAFRALVQQARSTIPDVRITTDLIVGFPGETDDEFATSLAFAQALRFDGMHVFRYSRRPGTPAARMRDHVPLEVSKARSQQMHALAQAGEADFIARHIGRALPVLWEHVAGATPQGFINTGCTHNYLRVQAVHPRVLTNLITPARLLRHENGVLQAAAVIQSHYA